MDQDEDQLELGDDARTDREPGTALERLRAVSAALSDAARRTRVAYRRRGPEFSGGFGARRGALLVRVLLLGSFVCIVAAPTLATAVYFYGFATDQYVSEADFTVSMGETPIPDAVASMTGLPAMAVLQDTQIVVNYIHSRAAVEKLEEAVALRSLYSRSDADGLARFDKGKSIERFLKYWKSMATATILMPAGIIQLKIRAFTPDDARKIAQASLEICEQMVNDLNARANNDAVHDAEEELGRSARRVANALSALEVARNASGILDTSKSEEALESLIKDAKSRLLSLQGAYDSGLKYVTADAPQMKELGSRIDVTRKQITEIESKLTVAARDSSRGEPTLADTMTKFGELDLERSVAEKLYATAASALEAARLNAEDRQLFFKTFVFPVTPQEPQFPRRALNTVLVGVVSLLIWAFCCALGALVRNNMA